MPLVSCIDCSTRTGAMSWSGLLTAPAGKISVRFDDPLTGVPPDQLDPVFIPSGSNTNPPLHVCVMPSAGAVTSRTAVVDATRTACRRYARSTLHLREWVVRLLDARTNGWD